MKKSFRLLTLLLCMIMLLLPILSACDKPEQPPENTTPNAGNTPGENPGNPVTLIKDKISNYTIVYDGDMDSEGMVAVNELKNVFVNRTVQPVTSGKDTEIAESACEILIGATDRAASAEAAAALGNYAYTVRYIDQKVVIYASKSWLLSAAVTAFLREVEYERDANKDINSAFIRDTLAIDFDCTKSTEYSRPDWVLPKFPAFFGGTLVRKTYTKTAGFKDSAPTSKDYQMQFATDADAKDFIAYANAMAANGYTVTEHAGNPNSIISYWVESGKDRMYMYYTASTREARFIIDQNDSVPLSEFEYTYEKKSTDTTTFYLYGFKMHQDGINVGETYPALSDRGASEFYAKYPELKSKAGLKQETYKNCGSMFVIKLADNSVMIIDGGEYKMMCVEQAIYLNEFLHEITDTPMNEKVRISCWFITHPHGDHFTGFLRFMNGFHQYYEMERVMYNIETHGAVDMANLKKWYPDMVYHKVHTGESFQIADMKIDVLFTLEDLVASDSMDCEYWTGDYTREEAIKANRVDDNNTSATLRLHIDGKTVLITGDAAGKQGEVMLRNYEAGNYAELKADILQIPHHGWNNLPDLFNAVNPSFSVFNQSKGGAQKGLTGDAMKTYNAAAAATKGGEKNMYFGGDETVGFEVSNGKFVVAFREAAVGYAWDGSDGGAEHHWSTGTAFPSRLMPNY